MPDRWHITHGEPYVLARRAPARFDLAAEAVFPRVRSRRRLAQQIRQDLWRDLKHQRGFSPVIEIRGEEETLRVRAGGRVDGAPFDGARLEARISALLADPARRTRWLRYAGTEGES